MSKHASTVRPLTGYALESQFRKLRTRWQFTPLEHYVFSELIALCNEAGWPAKFSATNSLLIGGVGCSEKGLISARKRLAEAGLISFVEGRNRRPTSYRFYRSEHLPEVSLPLEEHLPEGLPQVSVSEFETSKHLPEGLPKDLPEVSPYKEQTKTKNIMLTEGEQVRAQDESVSTNPPTPTTSSEQPTSRPKKSTESALDFDTFWQAYGRKVGRLKSEQRWKSLTSAERTAALVAVPAYVARTPDLQFRKHPLTWLNGKHWLDEQPSEQFVPTVGQTTTPPAPRFDVDALFGHNQSAAEGLAQARNTPEYQAFLAREAARTGTNS